VFHRYNVVVISLRGPYVGMASPYVGLNYTFGRSVLPIPHSVTGLVGWFMGARNC